MNAFAFHQFGVDHQNQYKGNADLADDTGDDKIDIVTESFPEGRIVEQLGIVSIPMKVFCGPPFHSKKLYTSAVTSGTNTVKINITTGTSRSNLTVFLLGLIAFNI